jgi:integrase
VLRRWDIQLEIAMTLLTQYLMEIAPSLARATVERYRQQLLAFDAWQRENKVYDYDRKNARDFLVYLRNAKTGPASIALHKAALSAFYSWLTENDHIASNPIPALKFGSYSSPKRDNECTFTEEEYAALKKTCLNARKQFQFWYGAVIVGWNTGLRLGDVAGFGWEHIDMDESRIDVEPRKTCRLHKRVEIPLLPELREWLTTQDRSCKYFFPGMRADYAERGAKILSLQFGRICATAGIKGKSFHMLRHTFTSRLLNKRVPLSMVTSTTGHTLSSLQRYAHTRFDEKADIIQQAMA